MEKLPKEILDRLDALSIKLGTTVEHLWEVLNKQVMVDAAMSILWVILTITFTFISFKILGKWYSKADKAFEGDDDRIASTIIRGAIGIIATVSIVNNTYIIAGLFNPEYIALKELMYLIGKI